ncbi:transmembrane protein 65 [Planococcus citri]|uniref:transmembrane protein 65 n=1 Tax=Planococcus citri TaxID=170843 RepID=UPI0031F7D3D5
MSIHKFGHLLRLRSCSNGIPSIRTNEVIFRKPRHLSTLPNNWVQELVSKLDTEQRQQLMIALKTIESEETKADFRGQLAAYRWRTKLGRPSKVAESNDVDATGSYCPLPDDWFIRKVEESTPKPTHRQLLQVGIYNAVPFIGFGFLDNSIMIIGGDSIEMTLGSLITLSTMAAAALGNTFSDIMGIGSAYYVEKAASKLGVKQPALSPIQMNMSKSRLFANLGRTIGVTIGCLLGMFPLLFKSDDKDKSNEKKSEK